MSSHAENVAAHARSLQTSNASPSVKLRAAALSARAAAELLDAAASAAEASEARSSRAPQQPRVYSSVGLSATARRHIFLFACPETISAAPATSKAWQASWQAAKGEVVRGLLRGLSPRNELVLNLLGDRVDLSPDALGDLFRRVKVVESASPASVIPPFAAVATQAFQPRRAQAYTIVRGREQIQLSWVCMPWHA